MPTWYVLNPLVRIINDDASLGDVAFELSIGIALCVALLFAVKAVSSRTVARLGTMG